ncbi:MAG: DUF378 domain-containing protein [Armatimonadetes bacterium]|jgi:uncharacterized membrane protein YuzA (DUF378 family)|nr:DUF378 domain-containing protein [Armatimonadota bacterium]
MKTLDMLSRILVIVGGLNWGLVGIAKFDLVATLLGAGSALANIVYVLVGISAVVQAIRLTGASSAPASAHAH